MRALADIQRAHDLLIGIILGEAPLPHGLLITADRATLQAQASVLCWVLEHAENPSFAQSLVRVEAWLKEHGVVLENKGN